MIRIRWLLVLWVVTPVTTAAQDPADLAWRTGNHAEAEQLYRAVLAADSNNSRALHRLALINAWAERYDTAFALIDRMLTLYPDNVDAQIDRARFVAWQGNLGRAITDLQAIIDAHPSNLRALSAQAQFAGWAGETDQAMAAYTQIMEITPNDPSIRRNQAMVLTWAARHSEARAIYDSLLQIDPNDEDALLALGRLLSWSGQLDSAAAVYRQVLRRNPRHIGAMQGEARTVTWSGDLVEGEARWRRTLEIDPDNVESLVGLAQTLRWQGRPGRALVLLERALELSPNDRDVQTQLRWAQSSIEPRASTVLTQESDSDGNRVWTTVVRAAWRPHPAVQLGADVYRRSAQITNRIGNAPTSAGVSLSFRGQLEPGWAISASMGASQLNNAAGRTVGSFAAGVATPSRNRVNGSLSFARTAFDYTRTLIENGVTATTVDASARVRVTTATNAGAGVGWARFNGSTGNRRLSANANVTHRLHPQWTLGVYARMFGYQLDLTDGYFDPSYFGIFEIMARWSRTMGRFNLQTELAPGTQQVRSATLRPTVRASARLGYTLSPGRDVSLQGAYSSAGLQNIATTSSDYRYYAVSLAASWLF